MHVLVAKRDLERILARCQAVAEKKSHMPALVNVLLRTTPAGELSLVTTDLTVSISGLVPARIEREGSTAVPVKDLFERVRYLPEGEVALESTEGHAMTVRSVANPRRYTLHGIAASDFPRTPEMDPAAAKYVLPAGTFSALIRGTHFSIATDDTRQALASALFEWDADRVRMVTTDGHRLSKAECVAPTGVASMSLLIPRKGIQELRHLCEESLPDDPVTFAQVGPNAIFQVSGFQFSVKLVDFSFPPYQQVIPESSSHTLKASRDQLSDALRAIRIAASERTGAVHLTLAEGTLRIESESPDTGAGFDEIPVESSGGSLSIGFNAQYFLDVLQAIDHPTVQIGLGGELDPAVIRPDLDDPSSDYLAVVMPMRI